MSSDLEFPEDQAVEDSQIIEEPSPEASQVKPESTPLERQRAFLRQRYAILRPGKEAPAAPSEGLPVFAADIMMEEHVESASLADEGLLPTLPHGFQRSAMAAYRERQRSGGSAERRAAAEAAPGVGEAPFILSDAPLPAPYNNWVPLGPAVLRQGQALNRPAVSGRVAGIAVAPGGLRLYVASANGGVWRSDDGGHNWHSTMDAWDLNPTTLKSDSLACGAIALDPNDPDRVYVGTGEGGAESFFGVGPIRSDDGGVNWIKEETSTPETTLDGSGFYQLALDPSDRERVVGATELGLYLREPDGAGGFHWVRKREGIFTSVVAGRTGGTTIFYAAKQTDDQSSGSVLTSTDGDRWDEAGAGFPTQDTYRIALAVQPTNPNVVYALVCRQFANNGRYPSFHLRGVWRFDRGDNRWRNVTGAPADLFGEGHTDAGQGWYDIAIAVDPNNINRVYLGGSTKDAGGDGIYPSSVYGCLVTSSGSGAGLSYQMTASYIGSNVHADVHVLVFTPGDSNRLWVGCDGGIFYTSNATGAADFSSRNVGLATLTMNYFSQHPTEEAVIFCGTQDNGTSRYTGEEVWLHSCWGDGGFVVINWHDPRKILRTYVNGIMQRAIDGGQCYDSWLDASLPSPHSTRSEFYAPLVGTPDNPDAPAEAEIVAFGGVRLWLTTNFGKTWRSLPSNDVNVKDAQSVDVLPQADPRNPDNMFRSLAFATAKRIYGGTTIGEVYRYDRKGTTWTPTPIHADPLLKDGPITSIAIDTSDESGNSIYVTLGGHGDFRHVWHFDGQQWEERSGPADSPDDCLLDVQHNAIVVDPANTSHLYVGADIGVWRSTDGGLHWSTFSYGLPDSAVLDLQIHALRRLLRAATHGRGIYEYKIDTELADAVELYIRDTQLDTGRRPTEVNLNDPTQPGQLVQMGQSPDIKVDSPSLVGGYQTPTNQIDFYQFVDQMIDRSREVATVAPNEGMVNNRVYVQIHNRGLTPAQEVKVVLLLAKVAGGIPQLPANFEADVQQGNLINTSTWRTIGVQGLNDVRPDGPKIAAFDLPSNVLPSPGQLAGGSDQYCLLVLLHSPDDMFTNGQRDVEQLTTGERKAAFHSITVVPFQGVHAGLATLDVEENMELVVWGKRRSTTGDEYIYVRPTDRQGSILDDGTVKVEMCAFDREGTGRQLQPMSYNRSWRSFWLRANDIPHVETDTVKVMIVVSGDEHKARKTQVVRLGAGSKRTRVGER